MLSFLRKVEKVNILMIAAYGFIMIVSMFTLPSGKLLLMLVNFAVSMVVLYFMDQLMKHEPIVYRSPIYYYTFLFFTTITVYIDGGYLSPLFPSLFFIPVLYVSVNFSRKGSTGIGFFAVIIILFTLLQDPMLAKQKQVIFVSLSILALPHIVGLLVTEYVNHMKKLIKLSRVPYHDAE